MVRSIVKASGITPREAITGFFSNVSDIEDAKYAEAYLGLESITGQDFWPKEFWYTGYERYFDPDRVVLKNEAAEVLRLFGYPDYQEPYQGEIFSDVFRGTRFAVAIEALAIKEIIPELALEVLAPSYCPKCEMSRGAWFVFLDAVLEMEE